jgi:hypothetical protein
MRCLAIEVAPWVGISVVNNERNDRFVRCRICFNESESSACHACRQGVDLIDHAPLSQSRVQLCHSSRGSIANVATGFDGDTLPFATKEAGEGQ